MGVPLAMIFVPAASRTGPQDMLAWLPDVAKTTLDPGKLSELQARFDDKLTVTNANNGVLVECPCGLANPEKFRYWVCCSLGVERSHIERGAAKLILALQKDAR